MSQIHYQTVVPEQWLDDDLLLSSALIDQVNKLRSYAASERTEVDMSTLRVGFFRSEFGLTLRASALETVTVHSEWVGTGPLGDREPARVLVINHLKGYQPWITLDSGWCGRLDYFHRNYKRYVAAGKEAGV